MSIYEDVKQALQDIVAPELQAIRGEIQVIRGDVKRLDEKIDLVRSELLAKTDAVYRELLAKIDAVYRELLAKIELVEQKVMTNRLEFDLLRQEMESFRREVVARLEAQEDRLRMVIVHVGDIVAMHERLATVEAIIKYRPSLTSAEREPPQLPPGS
jgi:chromosome segregation ATPase